VRKAPVLIEHSQKARHRCESRRPGLVLRHWRLLPARFTPACSGRKYRRANVAPSRRGPSRRVVWARAEDPSRTTRSLLV